MSQTVLALAGDVMLGRGVHDALRVRGSAWPWGDLLLELGKADGFFINLECALTPRQDRWRDGGFKPFYFRSDPGTAEALRLARVDFASLANNHIGDFGHQGLLDTIAALDAAGIRHAGAGRDLPSARAPAVLEMNRLRVAVVAAADHPVEWAAASSRPGLFYVGISPAEDFTPVAKALAEARRRAEFVIFTIHWGPNMCERPSAEFRDFAHRVIGSGADVFWGHSAHVVQGVEVVGGRPILYDTGDLVDDYMVDETLRNDLSAVFFLRVDEGRVRSIDLLPVKIAMEQVRRATGADREWFADRMRARCAEMDTPVLPGPDRGFLAIPVAREARVSPSKP